MEKRYIRKSTIKKRHSRALLLLILFLILIWIIFLIGATIIRKISTTDTFHFQKVKQIGDIQITEMFLTPNEYSRPETLLPQVNGIVIHYTANPGTDAENNRNYFENLKDSHETHASSHFIIGLDGTIIQCIPLNEISYASNNRNADTISIECCHPTKDGKFTKETYESLMQLCAWLCGKYNLREDKIIRHYDITQKDCPRYFVANEDKWQQLKKDIFDYIEENGE